jgi:hypothetical protein
MTKKRNPFSLKTKFNLYADLIWLYFRYEGVEGQLLIGIEQGRNLSALAFPQGGRV